MNYKVNVAFSKALKFQRPFFFSHSPFILTRWNSVITPHNLYPGLLVCLRSSLTYASWPGVKFKFSLYVQREPSRTFHARFPMDFKFLFLKLLCLCLLSPPCMLGASDVTFTRCKHAAHTLDDHLDNSRTLFYCSCLKHSDPNSFHHWHLTGGGGGSP